MRPHRETKSLIAAVLAGAVCGGLSTVFATTILAVARPAVITVPVALAVWVVAGLTAAAFCWRPGSPRHIWGRVAVTIGLLALALPVAAALALGATGIWPPAETADLGLSLQVFGVRLVAGPATIRIGVGGFVLGLILVAIGDRALRGRDIPDRIRSRSGRLFR
jgi:hypothetical protein